MCAIVSCTRCGREIVDKIGCRHLRWTPERGGPIDFARYVVHTSPYTQARGLKSMTIPQRWWEVHFDWLLERIEAHMDVHEGFVFGETSDLDLLCMDLWHKIAPEPTRAAIDRDGDNGKSVLSSFLRLDR